MKSFFGGFKSLYDDVCYLLNQFKKCPKGKLYVTLRVINMILNTIFPIVYIVIPGMIINELSAEKRTALLVSYIAIVSIIPLMKHLKELTLGLYINRLTQKIIRYLEVDLHSYIADMEYSSLESPEIAIQKSRILNGAPEAPIDMLNLLLRFLQALIGLVSVATIIIYLNAIVVVVLLLIIVVNSIVHKRINKIIYAYGQERSKKDIVFWSEFDNLSNPANGKEIRLFELKDFFIKRYLYCGCEIDNLAFRKDKKIRMLQTITALTGATQQVLLYIFPVIQVLYYNLAVGSMTIFMSAGSQFANSVEELFKSYLEISNYCLHVEEIKNFRSKPSLHNIGGTKIPVFEKNSIIEFRNVSFKYPGSENFALRNFNIKIPYNQKICIVGENGAGKSTFLKLLTGLYCPTEGEILLDGINIQEFDRLLYTRLFAPVFQDYCKYSLPLSLNIALSEDYNNDKISTAIDKSGLSGLVEKLSKGLNTYVGKKIDESGFEPSGGEGQKMAIARAIYHERPIYLLDEPTAALDPATEYEIYSTFSQMITDHTTILITHRMSAVQLADCIVVFKDGQVVEYGTHKELYANGGIYSEMFNKQSQFYKEDV